MAMGVKRPGYQLVSLLNPMNLHPEDVTLASTHLSQLCLLPDQNHIYTHVCKFGDR